MKNLIKIKEGQKEYRVKNLDKVKEVEKEYRIKNNDKRKETQKEYYEKNKGNFKEYYKKNVGNIKESEKEYKLKNLDKIKERQKDHRMKNIDKYKETEKEYRTMNKVKINKIQKENRIKKLDKFKEVEKDYRLKNKDKIKEIRIQNMIENNPNYVPYYSWKSREESRMNFESIASLFHINELSDWYRISMDQIKQLGGGGIAVKFGTLENALKYTYPEYSWESSKFTFKGKKSTQRWLWFKLKELLPNIEVLEDFNHPDLVWEKRKRAVQLDIWIPEYNLALEYQGEHHYYDSHIAYGTGSTSQRFAERDEEKKRMCLEKGVSLICIPYWWDRKVESLCSTLNQTHPTIFPKTDSPPIPHSPPNSFEQISLNQEGEKLNTGHE